MATRSTVQQQLPVLVVGAGPVGLTMAIELVRRGVAVCCVERAEAASPLSKALLVWPRTLQVLRGLGGGAAIDAAALPVGSFRYYSSSRLIADLGFDTRTRPVILPQPDIEALLADAFDAVGGKIERGVRMTGLEQDGDSVVAFLRTGDNVSGEEFSYVVGCDGAGSTVREALGLGFEGATYPMNFMLADVRVEGPIRHDAVHYYCSPKGVLVLIGLPNGRYRVFTSAPPELGTDAPTMDLLQSMVDLRGPGGLRLHDDDWSATFAVHARHAERYRSGRVFLAGDAAHIHSPAGGQGLNTGVTDAHNLAWKLASAWHGHAGDTLLESYATERTQVANAVVRQADLQTRAWLIKKPTSILLRDTAVRAAAATRLFDRDYIPWLTGLRTAYRAGAIAPGGRRNPGRAGVRDFTPGALLPDRTVTDAATGAVGPLTEVISDLHHTLLIVGGRTDPAAPDAALAASISKAGPDFVRIRALRGDGFLTGDQPLDPLPSGSRLVLVRPDHHVAAVAMAADPAPVAEYLNRYFLAPIAAHSTEESNHS